MSLRPIIALAAALLLLPGCGKPSATTLAAQEQAKIREEKRVEALKVLKELQTTFPDQPRAKEAPGEIAPLEAAAPKK